ncbi:hypothetical protein ACFQ48_17335 [Hymenobacter caeli]|uniref:Fibronectin type III domain-containing protein n=1 Tax=Hymenobacter caeli TaxID=2735894 RepID=A0ABX2FUD4_9BACT|nr:hypothetical protein [Hymenobacter caeli]NRT20744.1 hypothetical protein [Hymenobacter caeli]
MLPAALGLALLPRPERAAGRARWPQAQLSATCDGAAVRLDWAVADETDVAGYGLYRRLTTAGYVLVAYQPAVGRRRYRCFDAGAACQASGEALAYRLVTRRRGPAGNQAAALADGPGAVARSWDTIKEVFK